MKLYWIGLAVAALGLLAQGAGAQDIAYPRFSPLPVRQAADAAPTPLSLPFGAPLRVVGRGADHVLVLLADGRRVQVRPGDVVIPAGTAQAVAGPGFGIEGRVRLSFWDSPLRAQGFLRDGPSDQTRPLLVEAGAGGMPAFLPVSEVVEATTRTGRPVQIAAGLVPLAGETLAMSVAGPGPDTRGVSLHVIVDGSSYARTFSEGRLQDLSRRLEAQTDGPGGTLRVTRTVLHEAGTPVGPDAVPLSDLRRRLPEPAAGKPAPDGLSTALIGALVRLRPELEADAAAGRASLLLILLGPGLRVDVLTNPAFLAASETLRRAAGDTARLGLLLGSATPEPSDVPDRVRAGLGAGLPGAVVGFGDSLAREVAALSLAIHQREAAAGVAKLCEVAQARAVPCLMGPDAEHLRRLLPVPAAAGLEWFSLPLWFVVDGSTLALVERQPQDPAPQAARPETAPPKAAPKRGEGDLRAAQADLTRTRGDLAKAQEAARGAEQSLSALQVALSEERTLRNRITQERDAIKAEQTRTAAALATARDDASAKDRALRDAAAAQAALSQRLAEQDRALATANGAIKAAEAGAEDLKQRLRTASGLASDLAGRLARREAEVADLSTRLDETRTAQAQADERAAALEAALSATTGRLAAAEAALTLAQDRADLAESDLASREGALTEAEAELARLGRTLADQQSALAGLTDRTARQAAEIDSLTATLATRTEALAQTEAGLGASLAEVARLETALSAAADTAAREAVALTAAQELVARLEATAKDQAATLAAERAASDAAVATLEARLTEAEATRAAQEAAHDRTLAEARARLAAREARIAALAAEAGAKQQALATAEAEAARLQGTVAAQAAQLAEVKGMLKDFWASADTGTDAGTPDSHAVKRVLEHQASLLATAEAEAEGLRKARQDLEADLQAARAQAGALQALHAVQLDDMRAAHAADLSREQVAAAAVLQGAVQTGAALAQVLADMAQAVGVDPAVRDPDAVVWARRLGAAVRDRMTTWPTPEDQAAGMLAVNTRIDGLVADNAALQARAEAFAEENRQLALLLETDRRAMAARDATHQAEMAKLRAQLGASTARAEAAPRTQQPRPAARAAAAPPEPAPAAAALPGSPLQWSPGGAVPKGTGFFGN